MQCTSCDAQLPDDAAFCPECGEAVSPSNPAPSPAQTSAPPAVDPMAGGTVVIQRTDQSSGTDALEPGDSFADRYRIESTLGAGGMGIVYKAQDIVANQPVALKLINTRLLSGHDAIDRLIAEGVLTRKIQHRNVINVYDVGKSGDQPYLSMEYLDGESLRSWLGKQLTAGNEVSVETATGIINAILDGLAEAHSHAIVHRDLKPENVFLLGNPDAGDYRLKILDFGIARSVNTSAFTSSVSALGTLPYMAPEQKTTPDAAGPAADLYSVSRMFYELLMDVLPDGPWQPPSKHRSDVPPGFDALLEKGLSNRPRSRQQTVAEYRADLETALTAAQPGRVEPDAPAPPKPPPKSEEDGPIARKIDDTVTQSVTAAKDLLEERLGSGWTKRKTTWIAVGIVILIIAASLIMEDETGSSTFGTSPTPPVTRTAAGPALQGDWVFTSPQYGDRCVRWRINQTGTNLSGHATMLDGTPAQMSGQVSGSQFHATVSHRSTGQPLGNLTGNITQNGNLVHVNFPGMLAHVNHEHTPPFPC